MSTQWNKRTFTRINEKEEAMKAARFKRTMTAMLIVAAFHIFLAVRYGDLSILGGTS